MKFAITATILAIGLACSLLVMEATAGDPIFVKWLVVDDPGDETIRDYWERAEAGELGPAELMDLGTMLFYRGYPNDAVKYFREALDQDPELSDAWFRVGLVKHRYGDFSAARSAYKKCLKLQSGHAWGNFYLALLEEQTGDAQAAIEHYQTAFKHAPGLANPEINPEILSSKLQLGAVVRHFDARRFEQSMPMPYLDPASVQKVLEQNETRTEPPVTSEAPPKTAPEPTPAPAGVPDSQVQSSPAPRSQGSTPATSGVVIRREPTGGSTTEPDLPSIEDTPYGVPVPRRVPTVVPEAAEPEATAPEIRSTSPEASLRPLWPGMHKLIDAFV